VLLFKSIGEYNKFFKNRESAELFIDDNFWAQEGVVYTIPEALSKFGWGQNPYGLKERVNNSYYGVIMYTIGGGGDCCVGEIDYGAWYDSDIVDAIIHTRLYGNGKLYTKCASTGANITIVMQGKYVISLTPPTAVVLLGGMDNVSLYPGSLLMDKESNRNLMFINTSIAEEYKTEHPWAQEKPILTVQQVYNMLFTECHFCGMWTSKGIMEPPFVIPAPKYDEIWYEDCPFCALKDILWYNDGNGIIWSTSFGTWENITAVITNGTVTSVDPPTAVILVSGRCRFNKFFKDNKTANAIIDEYGTRIPEWLEIAAGSPLLTVQEMIENILMEPKVELKVTGIDFSVHEPEEGEEVIITATIENTGILNASWTNVLFKVGEETLYQESIVNIPAGESVSVNYTWTASAGEHIIRVIIDDDNQTNDYSSVIIVHEPEEKIEPEDYEALLLFLAFSLIFICLVAFIVRRRHRI
jgi:hypothetical protein